MKKNLKKILSIVMVLTMVFAMTATAFANTNSDVTVTVEFYDGDEFLMDWDVTIDPTEMTNTAWNALYTIPTLQANQYYNSTILMNNQRPSAMDATMKALVEMESVGDTAVAWDYYLPENSTQTEIRGGYISDIFGYTTQTDYSQTTGSMWVGNAWLYTITNASGVTVPSLYATNVALTDGMTITWTYTYDIHEPIV